MSAYIIWNPKSKFPPTVTHDSRPVAIRIAGRMAEQNPGENFFVCKLTNVAHKAIPFPQPVVKVVYTDLEKSEECPS